MTNIYNLIRPIFNIFLKFHLLVYFIFRNNDIGDIAILPRRHCDAESRMTTTAAGQCRGCLPRQTKSDLIKIEVKNQSVLAQIVL